MISIKHSPTGKGSVIFNDDKPLILIRNGDWTLHDTRVTIHSPPKEIQLELVRIALTDKHKEAVGYSLLKLGVDFPFEYTLTFREQSVKLTEILFSEI
ncbi:hypothetical protein G2248_00066 [Escherichia phage vB_EcoM_G2248]|nr:hypothetical protein G2248_00066 [Escherichia phage vB_EcoM_G2248]QBO64664.1 hypothetical protein G37_3_00067 [Escherichia phage vB_EcoM_G37-3]QBO66308.1 hypothetical protein G5211_00067 [Escherichia phage vB_EcoM_G5211]